METISFKPDSIDNGVQVMSLGDVNVTEIRLNPITREIHIVCEPVEVEDLSELNWREIKERVENIGGAWSNKKDGILFLMGGSE